MANVSNIKNRIKVMEQSDNRKVMRFAFDSIIRDASATTADDLSKNLKSLGITLNTKDSDGNALDEWTLSNDNAKFPAVKLSDLSKRYDYNNDTVKKALAANSLDPIPRIQQQNSSSASDTTSASASDSSDNA